MRFSWKDGVVVAAGAALAVALGCTVNVVRPGRPRPKAWPKAAFGRADLVVESFTAPKLVRRGAVVGPRLHLKVRNVGGRNAGRFFVGIYLSKDRKITTGDRLLLGGRESVAGLRAGRSFSVPLAAGMKIPPNVLPGNYYIGALVDETDAVNEKNEQNNDKSRFIRIRP